MLPIFGGGFSRTFVDFVTFLRPIDPPKFRISFNNSSLFDWIGFCTGFGGSGGLIGFALIGLDGVIDDDDDDGGGGGGGGEGQLMILKGFLGV